MRRAGVDRYGNRERSYRYALHEQHAGNGEPAAAVPGKQTLTQMLPIQRFAADAGRDADELDIQDAAREGTTGSSSTLPHLDAIQRAFGHHDVTGVRAYVGGAAEHATARMGARAYASGDDVAFASTPDLRLAAHEAAHVVQQRGGVRLSGGVGRAGDVYEQHADAVADRVVRGESAEALLDQMAHRGAAGGKAVQRDPGDSRESERERRAARRRAARLRDALEERRRELEDHHLGLRRESSIELEAMYIREAQRELEEAGRNPPAELVTRLAHEHDERLRRAREEDRARPETLRTVRVSLEARAGDATLSRADRERARAALRRLHELGADVTEQDLHVLAAETAIVVEEPTPVVPEASSRPHEAGTEVSVGLGGGSVTVHDGHGGSVEREVSVSQSGISGEITTEPASHGGVEHASSSYGLGVSLEMGADGIRGADITASAGCGAVSGELSFGVTYYADRPQRQPDGSYRVAWRLAVRAGSEASHELSARLGDLARLSSASIGLSGELTRQGTDVFRGSTPDEALARAREFQDSFRTLDLDTIVERFERLATADLGSPSFWSTAPVGTERAVELAGTITPALSGRVFDVLSVGVEGELELAPAGKVKKVSETQVDVEEQFEVSFQPEPTIGAFGIGVTGAGMIGLPTQMSYKVTFTYRVDLAAGATAFADFLAHRALLDGSEAGVRLASHEVETETGEGAGVRLGALGRISGSERVSTTTATEYDGHGVASERVTHHARQDMTGNTVTGAYTHRGMVVDAPTSGGSYVATSDIHSTDGAESRDMLAEETATHGTTGAATSSGHWVIREEMSQEEMRTFHVRLIARSEEEFASGTAYGTLYRRLRAIPTDATGDAARAEAVATFLSVEGRRGLDMIQSTGGFEVEQSLRLFTSDGEDTNFLGASALHALETRIAEYRAAAAEHRIDGLAEQIQADIELLEPRLTAVSDQSRYTDLPSELRERVCGRYEGLLAQLRATLGLIDDACATDYSAATRGVYRDVQILRDGISRERSAAAGVRDRVVAFRRYYGQIAGHAEASLDPESFASTESRWSSAETTWIDAEDALDGANERLASVRGAAELDAERGYRAALVELERAQFEYRQAHAELDALAAMYERATTVTESEAEPTSTSTSTPDRSHGRDRRRRHASESASPEAEVRIESAPRAGIVLARCLAPFIHVPITGTLADLEGHTTVDRGPARMPSGLVVELLAGRQILVVDAATRAELGERRLFDVTLRIVTALPGASSFLVPQLRGGAINNEEIANHVGETFAVVVAC